jgi:predicted transcriptional regulator
MSSRTKVIQLDVRPTKEVLTQFATTLESARKHRKIQQHVGISFESIEGLRKILTQRRLELLSVVRHKKPQSIYQLSKLLNRDLKSVNTDLRVLKQNDFIEFKKINHGRQRLIPIVEFDKIDIMVKV